MRTLWVTLLVAATVLSGCSSVEEGPADTVTEPVTDVVTDVQMLLEQTLALNTSMVFVESVVDAAVSVTNDLYEPTMEVSDTGAIFITGHTAVVDTTGAPIYGSWDNGETWEQLPFTRDLKMPGDLPGATPPVTDEIFLVAGDDGWLYGVDITLATFPVNAWNDDGKFHAYYNPNAYDEHQVVLQADECTAAPAKDRPWAAFGNGKLLMVSNPAAGPVQIGVLDVPSGPLGLVSTPYGIGATTGGGKWNVCAGIGYHTADNRIPGIPDMRDDGLFIVPQLGEGGLYLIRGNANNIFQLDVFRVFETSTFGEITSVYGQAAFDDAGDLFLGITENKRVDAGTDNETVIGQIHLATSTDGGMTFEDRIFQTGEGAVRHFYMDGNRFGEGTFMVWAVDGNTTNADGNVIAYDWYAAHVHIDETGAPILENVSLIIDEGKRPSAHVTGAAVGPDGRGYTAMYESQGMGGTPLSVFLQTAGPTMPGME